MAEIHKDIEVLSFKSQNEFENWLKVNFKDEKAYWLKLAKKNSKYPGISYVEARETAIKHGWIDGLINKYDEDFYLIRFSHRRPKSIWSKINVGIATELIESGQMTPEGQAEVNAAKSDGRWDKAY